MLLRYRHVLCIIHAMSTQTNTSEPRLGVVAAAEPERDLELPAAFRPGVPFTLSDRALDRLLADILKG